MSDVGTRWQLQRSNTQLPVDWYFDPMLFERERQLFNGHSRYIGHELMVPEPGSYFTLAQEGDGRMLVRNARGVEIVSNVCRHRQAIMMRGRGTVENIVCPVHRWTYGLDGALLGAPFFEDNPCLGLAAKPLDTWNGLLFEHGQATIDELRRMNCADFDFSGYRFDHVELHDCAYNWKTFIEVYLEDYHVGPFHPGLGNFVRCDNLRWEFGTSYSVQSVGVNEALTRPGTPTYRRWHDEVLRFGQGVIPNHGAVWLTIYPNVMVECYPNVLVISTLYPRGPQRTLNVIEFYYPEEIALFEPDYMVAEHAAYMETCAEDDDIALRMDAGRYALAERGETDAGPYQSPMEDGMLHFHEWLRRELGTATPGV